MCHSQVNIINATPRMEEGTAKKQKKKMTGLINCHLNLCFSVNFKVERKRSNINNCEGGAL